MNQHTNTTNPTNATTRHRRFRSLAATTVAAGIAIAGIAGAAPAGASTTKPIDTARTKCLEGVDKRLTALDSMAAKIEADKYLTDGHQASLEQIVSSTRQGVAGLRHTIESAADATALRTACTSVVEDHRVFALVARQVHVTRAGDAAQAAKAKLAEAQGKLDRAIESAESAGKDVAKAKADDAAFDAALGEFNSQVDAIPSVLELTPADYNADKNVIAAAQASLKGLRTEGKAVREAARLVRDDLKALKTT